MMTREEFDNIKQGDKIWRTDLKAPLGWHKVDEIGHLANGDHVVYMCGKGCTYEELYSEFQVNVPKEDKVSCMAALEAAFEALKVGDIVQKVSKEGVCIFTKVQGLLVTEDSTKYITVNFDTYTLWGFFDSYRIPNALNCEVADGLKMPIVGEGVKSLFSNDFKGCVFEINKDSGLLQIVSKGTYFWLTLEEFYCFYTTTKPSEQTTELPIPKDNLLINWSAKDHKTKTMKKKKAKKYKFHKGEFSDRVKQLVWDNRERMPISELVALYPEVLPKMTKWDKVNILLSMYNESYRTLDNMIEYIELYCLENLTEKQIKKYLAQF